MSKFVAFLFALLCGVVAVCVSSSEAFIYFLPDYEDNVIVSSSCHRQGYEYNRDNCPLPRVLENKCPSDEWYRRCACYGSESCTGDEAEVNPFPVETGSVRTSCKDCGGNLLYSWQCSPSGECDSYDLTDCPEHGYCSQCCDGFYKLESCASAYEVSGDVCELKETCFGEETRKSGADYSCTDCETKEGKRLYTCECVGNCNLESCPLYGTCSSDCKGNYCLTGCQEGYKLNSSATGCIDECDKVLEGCDTGYEFVNQCVRKSDGKTYGDCVNCKDETAFSNPCKGYYTCSGDGRTPDGDPLCYCGNVPYYKRCLVQETCFKEDVSGYYYSDKGTCIYGGSTTNGWYYVGDKCTTLTGTTYKWNWSCTSTQKDCMGGTAPCAGKKVCDDLGGGADGEEPCECGGKVYFSECAETCTTTTPITPNLSTTTSGYTNITDKELAEKYNNQPPEGKYYVCDRCTKLDGAIIQVYLGCGASGRDILGNTPPCGGMVHYDPATVVDTDTPDCECSGLEYYKESCGVGDRGVYVLMYGNGPEDARSGWEFIEHVCTTRQGKNVIKIRSCTASGQTCYGYKTCPSGTFVGVDDVCECGGVTYGKTCMSECNFEETEETCSTAGKSFNRKCRDSSGTWFGECV